MSHALKIHLPILCMAAFLLGLAAGIVSPCRGEENNPPSTPIVKKISSIALQKLLEFPGRISVDVDGRCLTLIKRHGLTERFCIGVYPSVHAAELAWHQQTMPAKTAVLELPEVGNHGHLQDINNEGIWATIHFITFQRDNVCCSFRWNGAREEAIAFAKKLDDAIIHDPTVAPRALAVADTDIEVVTPALLATGESSLIRYRTQPVESVCLCPTAFDTLDNATTRTPLHLTGTPLMLPAGSQNMSFTQEGMHHLDFTFITNDSVIITRTISVRVVPAQDMATLAERTPWELPQNALYLMSKAGQSWENAPAGDKEQISLTRKTFKALKPEPEAEETFQRIKAWNELVDVLRPAWLPPRELLTICEDYATPAKHRVAYAAYICQNCHVVIMSVIGVKACIYIEKAKSAAEKEPPFPLDDILSSSLTAPVTTSTAVRIGYAAKTFQRYRALTPDGPADDVAILLVQLTRPEGINVAKSWILLIIWIV